MGYVNTLLGWAGNTPSCWSDPGGPHLFLNIHQISYILLTHEQTPLHIAPSSSVARAVTASDPLQVFYWVILQSSPSPGIKPPGGPQPRRGRQDPEALPEYSKLLPYFRSAAPF